MPENVQSISSPRAQLFKRWFKRGFLAMMLAFLILTAVIASVGLALDPGFLLFVIAYSAAFAFLLAGFRAFFVQPDIEIVEAPSKPIKFRFAIDNDQTGTLEFDITANTNGTGAQAVASPSP